MSEMHTYQLNGTWTGGRQSVGKIHLSQLTADVSIPEVLGGANVGTNPEELLLCAAASCYMITLSTLLNNRQLAYVRIDLESTGFVDNDGGLRYDRIEHRPTIVVEQTVNEELVKSLALHAEHACMVSSALRGNVAVTVHPEIAVSAPSR